MREVYSVNEKEVDKETFLKVRENLIKKERHFSDDDFYTHDLNGAYFHARSLLFFVRDSESVEDFFK